MPIFSPGNTSADIDAFNRMMEYLKSAGPLNLGEWWDTQKVNINHNNNTTYDPNTDTINIDPYSALVVIAPDQSVGVQSPAMGLYHEIVHKILLKVLADLPIYLIEESVTMWETTVARLLGEPIREGYRTTGGVIMVSDPTQHTNPRVYWQVVDENGKTITGPKYEGGEDAPDINSGGGGSDGGGSGGGSGGGGGGGGVFPGESDPLPPDPDPSHWQNPNRVTEHNDIINNEIIDEVNTDKDFTNDLVQGTAAMEYSEIMGNEASRGNNYNIVLSDIDKKLIDPVVFKTPPTDRENINYILDNSTKFQNRSTQQVSTNESQVDNENIDHITINDKVLNKTEIYDAVKNNSNIEYHTDNQKIAPEFETSPGFKTSSTEIDLQIIGVSSIQIDIF